MLNMVLLDALNSRPIKNILDVLLDNISKKIHLIHKNQVGEYSHNLIHNIKLIFKIGKNQELVLIVQMSIVCSVTTKILKLVLNVMQDSTITNKNNTVKHALKIVRLAPVKPCVPSVI